VRPPDTRTLLPCSRCRRKIDFDKDKALITKQGLLCERCVAETQTPDLFKE